MSQRSMEMKVGGLILASILLLVGFIVVMGGLSLQPTFRVYVEFENPGALQSGSPVRIAGVRVGRVTALEFRGGEKDKNGKPALPIRVVADIDSVHQKAIHQDAVFFITAQGVLGEMHLAIDPGSPDKPPLADKAVVVGVSPPRLDQLLGESYELMHRTYLGMVRNQKQIGETFDGLHDTLAGTGRLFNKHEQDLSNIIQRLDSLTTHGEETLAAVREQYVDGPRIERILARLDHTTKVIDENLEPLMKDSRAVLSDGRKLTAFLADSEQLATMKSLSKDTQALLGTAKKAADDGAAILAQVKAGKGTAGALLMDETLYDDLQEMVRDLKQNPWKIMWKE
jgi:phospholipid/cholesterol/gamma-HCH transport system substrate-binding protein